MKPEVDKETLIGSALRMGAIATAAMGNLFGSIFCIFAAELIDPTIKIVKKGQ